MRQARKSYLAVVTSTVLVLLTVSPAWAYVQETGTKYCTVNQTQYTKSFSTGYTQHWPGPSGYQGWLNGSSWIHRTKYADAAAGGNWTVRVTDGALDDAGTYAACADGTP